MVGLGVHFLQATLSPYPKLCKRDLATFLWHLDVVTCIRTPQGFRAFSLSVLQGIHTCIYALNAHLNVHFLTPIV